MTQITVQFDIAFPTTDGSYLGLYTTTYPVAKSFSQFETANEVLFDFTCDDADVLADGGTSLRGEGPGAVGIISIFVKPSGAAAFFRGSYIVRECLVDLVAGAGNDDRIRIRASKQGSFRPSEL